MLIVTQVAPYVDGPAGVHGTLPQAVTALSELADLAGLTPVPVSDVRDVSPDLLAARPASWRSSPSGRRRGRPSTRAPCTRRGADGHLRVLGIHSATDASHTWPEYGTFARRAVRRPPLDAGLRHRRGRPRPSRHRTPRRAVALARRGLPLRDLRPDARVLLRLADGQVDLSAPGGRVPDCGFPLAWCIEDGPGTQLLHRARPLPSGVGAAGLPAPPGWRARMAGGEGRGEGVA